MFFLNLFLSNNYLTRTHIVLTGIISVMKTLLWLYPPQISIKTESVFERWLFTPKSELNLVVIASLAYIFATIFESSELRSMQLKIGPQGF